MDTTIAFAGGGLDRADHIRGDADKLGSLMNWRARLLRLEGIDPVISPGHAISHVQTGTDLVLVKNVLLLCCEAPKIGVTLPGGPNILHIDGHG